MSDLQNVEAIKIKPMQAFILVETELAPAKSAGGGIEIPHVKTADEAVRKGLVVAIGPDVKHTKVGTRVLYLHNTAVEIESFYRRTYGKDNPRVLMEEKAVIATATATPIDATNGKDVVRCLIPQAMEIERKKAMLEADRNMAAAVAGSNILRPN